MTTINTNNTAGGTTGAANSKQSLGQADFLRLMTTQLQFQDPTAPMDSSQMVTQLAQFQQVQGIDSMNTAMNSMASVMESDQTLRAAQMIGKDVLVETKSLDFKGGTVKGEVIAERGGIVNVDILDATGKRVARRTVTADSEGAVAFEWDGKDDLGNAIADGKYTIKATATVKDETAELSVRVQGRVSNVAIENYALALDLPGLGKFALGDVRRIES